MSAGNFGDQLEGDGLSADLETAQGTADPVDPVQEELPADRTLQARATEDRNQFLVERAMKIDDGHSVRNTPVTRPRIWTWLA
jgi:hypothetical protein